MTKIPTWLSVSLFLVVTVLGASYLIVGILHIDPRVRENTISIDLSASGGLRSGSEVSYRGKRIGRVTSVAGIDGAVRVQLSYDAGYRIPQATGIQVRNVSVLGEPIVDFAPRNSVGPYLADGAHLTTKNVQIPTTVAELLQATSGALDQLDPTVLNRLVDTVTEAVTGLDTATPVIGRGADLLATTLMNRRGVLEESLRNVMTMLNDSDWAKSAMVTGAPALELIGVRGGAGFRALFEAARKIDGGTKLKRWRPIEQRLVKLVQQVGPELGPIATTIKPLMLATAPALGSLNIGDLLEQALLALPGDSVRVSVTVPR
ncbi:MlaD family protein [Gordonia sp. CPCC 205333]|uniref:MlaD family protein n=1 Tax=Gordonia sp. CPCC 205333 TaxID=3140790 RepID=UPI003AF40996